MPNAVDDLRLRGLALPAIRSAGGYFAVKDKYDVAWGDLLLAIYTPLNARPMKRSFGSALSMTLFEMNSPATLSILKDDLREAIGLHCPHINVLAVEARRLNEEISVSITFGLQGDVEVQTRTQRIATTDFIRALNAAST